MLRPAPRPGVKKVIAWANRIRNNKPYIYGGGHGSFRQRLTAVRFGQLRAAWRPVRCPPPSSTGFMNWRSSGKDRWISGLRELRPRL